MTSLVDTCKPHFYYIKMGCEGVFNTRTCYHDDTNDSALIVTEIFVFTLKCVFHPSSIVQLAGTAGNDR